mmetsp:Transcript_57272/g.181165  ORF Transcript_57272/g.181165 Transcript_57272/m.181165 type:complete len:209 (+) Transcript_57272:1116-1742(+)
MVYPASSRGSCSAIMHEWSQGRARRGPAPTGRLGTSSLGRRSSTATRRRSGGSRPQSCSVRRATRLHPACATWQRASGGRVLPAGSTTWRSASGSRRGARPGARGVPLGVARRVSRSFISPWTVRTSWGRASGWTSSAETMARPLPCLSSITCSARRRPRRCSRRSRGASTSGGTSWQGAANTPRRHGCTGLSRLQTGRTSASGAGWG